MARKNQPVDLIDKPYHKWTRADYDHAEDDLRNGYDAWWRDEEERLLEEKMERAEKRKSSPTPPPMRDPRWRW
jgi:hypothetical protein